MRQVQADIRFEYGGETVIRFANAEFASSKVGVQRPRFKATSVEGQRIFSGEIEGRGGQPQHHRSAGEGTHAHWHLCCEHGTPPTLSPKGVLGVDLGIANVATNSDGVAHSGKHLDSVRHPYRRLCRKLQKKGTKGAKRRLKKLSGKERRFSRVNHTLGKRIVEKAQRTGRGIAIGDSTGIREQEAPTLHLAQLLFDLGL